MLCPERAMLWPGNHGPGHESATPEQSGLLLMYWRHEEIVRLSAWPTKVEARHFNLARRAMARLKGELRLPMRGLKTLDLIVQDGAWIIVDRAMNDLPIAASERRFHWPLGRRPDDHPGLSELDL